MDEAVLRRRGRPSKLDSYREQIGVLSDEEIAKQAGCSVANVYMYRRRHSIAAASEEVPEPEPASTDRRRGSVLDRYKHLLGKLNDAEVARLAGCTAANVSIYRRKHNIGATRGAEVEAEPTPAPAPPPVVEVAPPPAEEAPKARRGGRRKKAEVVAEETVVEVAAPAPVVEVAPPAPVVEAAPPAVVAADRFAYVVRIQGGSEEWERVVVGNNLPDALSQAAAAEKGGAKIIAVRLVGTLL